MIRANVISRTGYVHDAQRRPRTIPRDRPEEQLDAGRGAKNLLIVVPGWSDAHHGNIFALT